MKKTMPNGLSERTLDDIRESLIRSGQNGELVNRMLPSELKTADSIEDWNTFCMYMNGLAGKYRI